MRGQLYSSAPLAVPGHEDYVVRDIHHFRILGEKDVSGFHAYFSRHCLV